MWNELDEDIKVLIVEVVYKVVVSGEHVSESQRTMERKTFRRAVREKIKVEQWLRRGEALELELGPLQELCEVKLYFEVAGREYAIECRPAA